MADMVSLRRNDSWSRTRSVTSRATTTTPRWCSGLSTGISERSQLRPWASRACPGARAASPALARAGGRAALVFRAEHREQREVPAPPLGVARLAGGALGLRLDLGEQGGDRPPGLPLPPRADAAGEDRGEGEAAR